MVLFDEYVNKKIVIILRNGFRKFGTLLACDGEFVSLSFNDGSTQFIARREINELFLDKKTDGVRV